MVRIEGDRIVEVATTLTIPGGARVIDLDGATLLPGLIDLHTHLTDKYGDPLGRGPHHDDAAGGRALGSPERSRRH